MPKLFGSKHPDVTHQVALKICSHLDAKSLLESVPLVNKNWNMIISSPELKDARESAKDRMCVYDLIRRFDSFKPETPDTITVSRLGGGLTNKTYKFSSKNGIFVARRPGKKSDDFIDRKSESINLKVANKLGIAAEVVYDEEKGNQITGFLPNPKVMSSCLLKDSQLIKKIVHPLKVIHKSKVRFANDINLFERNRKMLSLLKKQKVELPDDYKIICREIDKIEELITLLKVDTVPCHNDTTPSNFIESNDMIKLIDWEYSGNNDLIWDLANLSMEAEFSKEQDRYLFQSYFGLQWDDLLYQRFLIYKPVVEFWAGLWAQVQIVNQNQLDKLDDLNKIEGRINNCYRLLDSEEFKTAFLLLCKSVNKIYCLNGA